MLVGYLYCYRFLNIPGHHGGQTLPFLSRLTTTSKYCLLSNDVLVSSAIVCSALSVPFRVVNAY